MSERSEKMYGENRIVEEKVSSVGRVQQGDGDLGEKDKSIIRKDSMNHIKTRMETTANSFGHAEERISRVGEKDAIQEKVTHGCKKTWRNSGVTKKQDLRTCGTEEVSDVNPKQIDHSIIFIKI